MTPEQRISALAIIFASTLFQAAVFMAALLIGNQFALILILCCMACCYLAPTLQFHISYGTIRPGWNAAVGVLFVASIIFGAWAAIDVVTW